MSFEIPVVVMAGGKSTRLEKDVEKPLLKINDKKMIETVLETVKKIKKDFKIAVTPNTPETRSYCIKKTMKPSKLLETDT